MRLSKRLLSLFFAPVVLVTLCAGCVSDSLQTIRPYGEDGPDCISAIDCPVDHLCFSGQCVPSCENPPCSGPGSVPDGPDLWVNGTWETEYHLDWSDYMGPLADLGTPLDLIDQLLRDDIDVPILDDYLDDYIPEWVPDLVHGLNSAVHFFQDVQVQGTMRLAHQATNPAWLSAMEDWEYAIVEVIGLCDRGELNPNYPACARLAIPLNLYVNDFGIIAVEAEPFVGAIYGRTVTFPEREVRIQMGHFISFVLDELTNRITGGEMRNLDDALDALVDCEGVREGLEDIFDRDLPSTEGACEQVVDITTVEIKKALDRVIVDWEVMAFDQVATAHDMNSDLSADYLAYPPGDWGSVESGDFTAVVDADLEGTWYGSRP